ncbi:MAG: AraC family transcriptional regulator [Candidatus Accumulibacter sp.]|jgi:AraC-like DNA-binding protein|nr:AraC family transcriptional regulator [Accumulibacter sp.]
MSNTKNDGFEPALQTLTRSVAHWASRDEQRTVTAVPGLTLYRHTESTDPQSRLYEPCVCFVAQGVKSVTLGEETYVYDARNYLISSLHLPGLVRIVEASREKPYLGLVLQLDLREISQLILDGKLPPPRSQPAKRGMATGKVTLPLIGAVQRLLDMLADESDIPILAPVIRREIYYRLLVGDQGGRLRQITLAGSQPHQIAQAISWLKENFSQPLSVDDLAAQVRMSTSTFHHHFRAMTAISPLQFQKQLRLQEARRLMLERQMDAAAAAFQVGYESPSQFSREYARLFGTPPLRDITNIRKFMAGEARA